MADRRVTDALSAMAEERRRLPWQPATIAAIAPLTKRATSCSFAPSVPLRFRAGQHLDVRLLPANGVRAERSYSIASAPETPGMIELVVERLEDGDVSPFFHDIAAIGDEIEIRGPIGSTFAWHVEDRGPLLLIGGGSGVVPLISMLRHRTALDANVPALLLYSARDWNDFIFRDELIASAEQKDGFELVLVSTREPPRRAGDHGRRLDAGTIKGALQRLPAPPRHVFICGASTFVETAAKNTVAAGVPAGIIRTEPDGS
jgi:ferredoxin-NADP reductase